MKKHSRDLGLWPTVLVMLLTVGTGAALWTMLSHSYRPVPRLCFALNVCCGSAIAAGAMTLALGAHLFERLQARPLVPALLLLGSSGAVVAILGELCAHTEAANVWSIFTGHWSIHSALAGGLWTLLIYFVSAVAEFAPGKQWSRHLAYPTLLKTVQIATIAATAALANFHYFTISMTSAETSRLSPLWATELTDLPVFSASLCAALAALLFASIRAYAAWGRTFAPKLLERIRVALIMFLIFSLGLRGSSLTAEALAQMSHSFYLFALLFVEVGVLVASLVFLCPGLGDNSPANLYEGSAAVLIWVVASRVNITITAAPDFGPGYVPQWTDMLLAFSILAIGVAGFAVISSYLAVFPEVREESIV
jgi:hypothetical protein